MSYRCGIGYGAEAIGLTAGPPMIICNGCRARYVIKAPPPKWFLDGKAPRGWMTIRLDNNARQDLCPTCVEKLEL